MRQGDWMQTYTGGQFWPLDPRAEEIEILDIAHALSLQCRYAGHVDRFYSTAEHCVALSWAVPPEHAFDALMHDASEAYLVDVPRPLKKDLANYNQIENRLMGVIAERFGFQWPMPPIVAEYDHRICLDERDALMRTAPAPWNIAGGPLGVTIVGNAPQAAKRRFLERFEQLDGTRRKPLTYKVAA